MVWKWDTECSMEVDTEWYGSGTLNVVWKWDARMWYGSGTLECGMEVIH